VTNLKNDLNTKISAYLRLAELCGLGDEEKKKFYMQQVESLLSGKSTEPSEVFDADFEQETPIKRKKISVKHGCGDTQIISFKKEITLGVSVEVGTNGLQGGDGGHGGVTYFKLSDFANLSDMDVKADNDGIEIIVGGDWELETIIECFKFAAETLHKMKEGDLT
jgi:hypothetical protein